MQEAVRKAILAIGHSLAVTCPHLQPIQPTLPLTRSAAAMAEAEAAHIAHGQRLKKAKEAPIAMEMEAARKEAKMARKATEQSRLFQAKLQAQIQQLATPDVSEAQAFASQRAHMAKESQAIAQKL